MKEGGGMAGAAGKQPLASCGEPNINSSRKIQLAYNFTGLVENRRLFFSGIYQWLPHWLDINIVPSSGTVFRYHGAFVRESNASHKSCRS
jgi:hypothetical protein